MRAKKRKPAVAAGPAGCGVCTDAKVLRGTATLAAGGSGSSALLDAKVLRGTATLSTAQGGVSATQDVKVLRGTCTPVGQSAVAGPSCKRSRR